MFRIYAEGYWSDVTQPVDTVGDYNGRQCSAMQAPFARFVCFEISRFRDGPTSSTLTFAQSSN